MKKGIAIVNGYKVLSGTRFVVERMKEEFSLLGVSLEVLSTAEVLVIIEDGKSSDPRLDADFILFLDKDYYTSTQLEKLGYKLFNNAEAIWRCDDKMLTHMSLADKGIKMPKTISGPLDYVPEWNDAFVVSLLKHLSLPMVAKTNFGSLGKGVFLLSTKDELVAWEKEHRHESRLYQEYIESSKGKDYRCIVIGGKFVAGMMRRNEHGDFRSNIAQGGTGFVVEIPKNYVEMAENAAKALNLDYCGVDILIGEEGEPILCEVNSNAYFEGIEKTTSLNVARIYAQYILDNI